jgi:hypothetical protein
MRFPALDHAGVAGGSSSEAAWNMRGAAGIDAASG